MRAWRFGREQLILGSRDRRWPRGEAPLADTIGSTGSGLADGIGNTGSSDGVWGLGRKGGRVGIVAWMQGSLI